MTPDLVYAAGNKVNTTTSAAISNSALTIPLTSVAGLNPSGGYLILERGTINEEIVYYTSISGSSVIIASNGRGRCGTTAKPHALNVSVQDVLVDEHVNKLVDYYDKLGLGEGVLIDGEIAATVSNNILTVSIVRTDGSTPTPQNPVRVFLNGAIRKITSALAFSIDSNSTNGDNFFGVTYFAIRNPNGNNTFPLFIYLGLRSNGQVGLGLSRVDAGVHLYRFSTTPGSSRWFERSPSDLTDPVTRIGWVEVTINSNGRYISAPAVRTTTANNDRAYRWYPNVSPMTLEFATYVVEKGYFQAWIKMNGTYSTTTYPTIRMPFSDPVGTLHGNWAAWSSSGWYSGFCVGSTSGDDTMPHQSNGTGLPANINMIPNINIRVPTVGLL